MVTKAEREQFWREGYLVVPNVLTPPEIEAGRAAVEAVERTGAPDDIELSWREQFLYLIWHLPGRSDVLGRYPRHAKVLAVLEALMGEPAAVIGGFMIDKPPTDNWAIPWHQDTGVWVDQLPPGAPEDIRGGHPVVKTEREELAPCITVRLSLDDAIEETGGMWVLPGSHVRNLGPKGRQEVEHEVGVPASLPAGGALFYVPLLFHRSEPSARGGRRRIVQISYHPRSYQLPFAGWYPWGLPDPLAPLPLLDPRSG